MLNTNGDLIKKGKCSPSIKQKTYTRIGQKVQTKDKLREYTHIRNTNICSAIILLLALISMVLFFVFEGFRIEAQNTQLIDPGEGGDGVGMEMFYLMLAVSAVEKNDLQKAVVWFETAADKNPEFAPAYIGIAHIHVLRGNHHLALQNAVIAYELNPNDSSVYYVLAEAHCGLSNYHAAYYNYIIYVIWVGASEQPILISRMVGNDSIRIIEEYLTSCMTIIP